MKTETLMFEPSSQEKNLVFKESTRLILRYEGAEFFSARCRGLLSLGVTVQCEEHYDEKTPSIHQHLTFLLKKGAVCEHQKIQNNLFFQNMTVLW